MSVNQVDKQTGDTSRIAGGTLYADAPIGAILAFGGATAPAGWMICNGAAVSRTTYAALFAAIGTAFGAGDGSTTFNIPDLREATTKGAGETGQTVGAHVKSGGLAVGEFIDDRVEKHTHFKTRAIYASSGVYEAISENGSTDPTNDNQYNTGRSGDTTEVKAVGVNYIIKAQQVALPADFATELDKKQNITDNTLETDSKTVPGAINEINTALTDSIGSSGDTFQFGTDGSGNYGYVKKVGGADTFFPFKSNNHTATKSINSFAKIDMGEDHDYRYADTRPILNIEFYRQYYKGGSTYTVNIEHRNVLHNKTQADTSYYAETIGDGDDWIKVTNWNSGTGASTVQALKSIEVSSSADFSSVTTRTAGTTFKFTDSYVGANRMYVRLVNHPFK